MPDRTLKKFAAEHNTPFYLYDEKTIRNSVTKLQQAFSWKPDIGLYFPVRMNPNPAILRILLQSGCGVSCCSAAELMLCAKVGFEGSKILYSPMILDSEGDRLCKKLNAVRIVNRENLLPEQSLPNIMLRLEPNRSMYRSEHCEIGIFGMQEHKLLDMLSILARFGTQRISLCVEGAAMEKRPDYFAEVSKKMFSLAALIWKSYGIRIDSIHLGSGLPFSYRHEYPDTDISGIAAAIQLISDEILTPAELNGIRISMEPGRYLAAGAGVFVTKVCSVYEDESPLIVTDGCMSQLERPSQLGNYHHISVIGKHDACGRSVSNVSGSLPDKRDVFAKKRVLPHVQPGDFVVVHDVGADGAALQNGYGGMPACAQYLRTAEGTITEIKAAQTPDNLLKAYGLLD